MSAALGFRCPPFREKGDRYVVIDDFLDADGFATARAEVDSVRLQPGLSDIDPVYDGFSFRGPPTTTDLCTWSTDSPTFTALLTCLADNLEFFEVDPGSGRVSFKAWSYPAGSRLSWHNDGGGGRLGAFVYFTHDQWRSSWGGELAIVDRHTREMAEGEPRAQVDDATSAALIQPRPNRLVLMRAYTFHSILRVDSTAGDRSRKTFSGFVTAPAPE